MNVRELRDDEILDALHLVWDVFAESVAPECSPEAVTQFQTYIKLENMLSRVRKRETVFWGAFEGETLCGVCAAKSCGEIGLLYVKKEWQRKGAARMLVQAAWEYCVSGLSLMQLTVHAAPQAVEMYRHLGFRQMGPEQEENGLRYIPMERMASPADVKPQSGSGNRKKVAAGVLIGAAIVVLLGVLAFAVVKIGSGIIHKYKVITIYEEPSELWEEWTEESPQAEEPNGETDSDTGEGIEGILCYIAENLPYTITEESYIYSSDGTQEYPMQFEVYYPQIQGMEGGKQDEINALLKECAMSTVDTLYLNPSDELKESMISQEQPFFASQVTYKVTYADADFISVAFSDHYFSGNLYAEFQDLRTRNLSLTEGTRYETADIVNLDDAFMKLWKERMREESGDAYILHALSNSDFRKILGGQILENRYYDNFFVDADGIQIGMTYHYNSQDENGIIARGWITAPFSREELEQFQTDSSFWNAIKE